MKRYPFSVNILKHVDNVLTRTINRVPGCVGVYNVHCIMYGVHGRAINYTRMDVKREWQ